MTTRTEKRQLAEISRRIYEQKKRVRRWGREWVDLGDESNGLRLRKWVPRPLTKEEEAEEQQAMQVALVEAYGDDVPSAESLSQLLPPGMDVPASLLNAATAAAVEVQKRQVAKAEAIAREADAEAARVIAANRTFTPSTVGSGPGGSNQGNGAAETGIANNTTATAPNPGGDSSHANTTTTTTTNTNTTVATTSDTMNTTTTGKTGSNDGPADDSSKAV
eukprot:TRINITY_DN3132_c2_g1_i1.p1 TRINITY_DN3132_c2_g1~~TRINITY_DN3132_c2_g1_i1.p1  ORF type:complete len:239 (-),score=40.18 TRINITY_DN3132_c2_g1_i1:115-774(-)